MGVLHAAGRVARARAGGLGNYNFTTAAENGVFVSGTMKAVYDNMRAIDLLSTFDYADTTKLGCIGRSLLPRMVWLAGVNLALNNPTN